jgi:hypothetical protein
MIKKAPFGFLDLRLDLMDTRLYVGLLAGHR